jgi:tRNA-2-methylthio-N6-dimethylallyladenosine synthase
VHFVPVDQDRRPVEVRPGDMVEVVVTHAAPHHLVADGPIVSLRRTAAGDAWEQRTAPKPAGVSLGLPTLGVPAPLPEAPACR